MKVLIESISSIRDEEVEIRPAYVTDERWEKVLRIRPLEDKKRSLLGGKLLHQMCEDNGIKNPVYGTMASGKPVLSNYSQLSFSLSHSGDYVVLVYEEGVKAIGVDIQQIREVSDGVKKRILHEEEWIWFSEEVETQRENKNVKDRSLSEENVLLNRIWAIKESYVKMTGEGLSHDFRKLSIDFDKKIVADENGSNFGFIEVEAPAEYIMAVVMSKY